jgi:sentrin-specific protease 1
MLQERDTNLYQTYFGRDHSYFFNSFFITKLLICDDDYKYANVKRWSKKIDIFEMDKIYFPININNDHWAMAVVYMKEKRICYYDSISKDGSKYVNGLMRWIQDEGTYKKGIVVDPSKWRFFNSEPTPQQENGFDCGVFSIMCADFISDNLPLQYNQNHMEEFRVKIAAAILRGELAYADLKKDD